MVAKVLGRKLPRIATAILLASAVGACSTAQDIEPVYEMNGERQKASSDDFHVSGIEHLRAGRFGLALHDLRKALQQEPDSVSTLNAIAIGYDELQRFDLSRRYYIKSLAIDPDSVQTLNNMGNSLLRQRKVKEALAYFEKARSIADRNATVRANLDAARQRLDRVASVEGEGVEPTADARSEAEGAGNGSVDDEMQTARAASAWIERTSPNVQTLVTRAGPEEEKSPAPSDVHPSEVSFRHFDMPIDPDPRERPSVSSPTVLSRSAWGPPLLLESSRVEEEAARLFHQLFLESGSDAPVYGGTNAYDISKSFAAPNDLIEAEPVRTAALAMAPALGDGIAIERAIRTQKIETRLVTPESIVVGEAVGRENDPARTEADTEMDSGGSDIPLPELDDVRRVARVPTSSVRVGYPKVQVAALGEPAHSPERSSERSIEMLVDTVAGDVFRRADQAIMSDLSAVAPVSDRMIGSETKEAPMPVAVGELPTVEVSTLAEPVAVDVPSQDVSDTNVDTSEEAPTEGPRPVTKVASLGFSEVEREAIAPTPRPAHSPMVGIGSFTIEVSNGAGRRYMAARLGEHLSEHGFPDAILTNAVSFNFMRSVIFYRPGFELAAGEVAATLPFRIDMQEYENKYADIRLRLGGDLLSFDKSLLTAMKGQ